jgi:hypothetical protein
MLTNLSGLLDKGIAFAQAKKFDPTVLANSRLAPDMFPLTRQVQIACDMVKNGVARRLQLAPDMSYGYVSSLMTTLDGRARFCGKYRVVCA